MRKLRPVIARTPEELAGVLGLSDAAAKEWPAQEVLVTPPMASQTYAQLRQLRGKVRFSRTLAELTAGR
jgi:hypothetical protein